MLHGMVGVIKTGDRCCRCVQALGTSCHQQHKLRFECVPQKHRFTHHRYSNITLNTIRLEALGKMGQQTQPLAIDTATSVAVDELVNDSMAWCAQHGLVRHFDVYRLLELMIYTD